jgi:hypothetical protein
MSRLSWTNLFTHEDELPGRITHEVVERLRVHVLELQKRYPEPAPATAAELRSHLAPLSDVAIGELAGEAGVDRRTLEAIMDGSRTPQRPTRKKIEDAIERRSETVARDTPPSWEEVRAALVGFGLEPDDPDLLWFDEIAAPVAELEEYARWIAAQSRTIKWPSRPATAANVRKARQRTAKSTRSPTPARAGAEFAPD